jgi:DNA-binding response OmpR family regulator
MKMRKTILVVDDEAKIVRLVRDYLEQAGFRVVTANSGRQALQAVRLEQPHLVILDLGLPEMDGLDVARQIHKESNLPIIMLTARVDEADRVAGLELGADDYVTKPFSPRELVARVRAVLRRTEKGEEPAAEPIEAGDVRIDPVRRQVSVAGRTVELTPTEFDLLAAMAREPGRVFTRLQLLEKVQGYAAYEGFERTIDAHIKNLRRKIEPDPRRPRYIHTVFGVGYRFEVKEDA